MSFQVDNAVKMIKPSHKTLAEVDEAGIKNYTTIEKMAKEFVVHRLKITNILNEAEVWPVGKVFGKDENGAKKKGKPSLAYDEATAKKAIEAALKGGE